MSEGPVFSVARSTGQLSSFSGPPQIPSPQHGWSSGEVVYIFVLRWVHYIYLCTRRRRPMDYGAVASTGAASSVCTLRSANSLPAAGSPHPPSLLSPSIERRRQHGRAHLLLTARPLARRPNAIMLFMLLSCASQAETLRDRKRRCNISEGAEG